MTTATHTPSWQFGPPEYPDCECEMVSQCCVASAVPDTDICGACHEHTGFELDCHCEQDEEDRRDREEEMRAEARAERWER